MGAHWQRSWLKSKSDPLIFVTAFSAERRNHGKRKLLKL